MQQYTYTLTTGSRDSAKIDSREETLRGLDDVPKVLERTHLHMVYTVVLVTYRFEDLEQTLPAGGVASVYCH